MSKEDVVPPGYDEEERYFYQREMEMLKKKREELDAAREQREQEASKQRHWMKCPKCGADLEEIEMDGVMVDNCPGCGGSFFDKGEIELMIKAHKGIMPSLRKFLT